MKPAAYSLLLAIIGSPTLSHAQVFANDNEPNNGTATAIPISLGASFEGRLDPTNADEHDFYSIVIPDDGVLVVNIECEESGPGNYPLSVHEVNTDMVPGGLPGCYGDYAAPGVVNTTATALPCMKGGAHFIAVSQLMPYAASYRITFTFDPLPFANDPEPNEDITTASVLTEGVTADGHLSVEMPDVPPALDVVDVWRIDKGPGPIELHTWFAAEFPMWGSEDFWCVHLLDASGSVIAPPDWICFDAGFNGLAEADMNIITGAVEAPGTYYLQFANSVSTCSSYRLKWEYTSTGVNDQQNTTTLFAYPNPASNAVTIDLRPGERLEITDMSGRLVYATAGPVGNITMWSVDGSAAGLYLLRAIDHAGSSRTAVVSVMKD